VVLSLTHLCKYHKPVPYALKKLPEYGPLWELRHLTLGVPKSYALSLPPALVRRLDKHPSEVSFTQTVPLTTQWSPWPIMGKEVPAADAAAFLKNLY
jgi:hypothetical protein